MVECEFNIYFISRNHIIVLIDTWWNVNLILLLELQIKHTVLIDTWWNVNSES